MCMIVLHFAHVVWGTMCGTIAPQGIRKNEGGILRTFEFDLVHTKKKEACRLAAAGRGVSLGFKFPNIEI